MDHELLDATPHEEQETAVIRRYFALHEAELSAAMLRSAGMKCFLANTESISAMGMEFGAIRLHVATDQVAKAEEILTEMVVAEPSDKNAAKTEMQLLWILLIALLLTLFVFAFYLR